MRVKVTIGRNIGSEPMTYTQWLYFMIAVVKRMKGGAEIEVGEGEWDGVKEENATISGSIHRFHPSDWAGLAATFQQDAIAVLLPTMKNWVLVKADGTTEDGWEA